MRGIELGSIIILLVINEAHGEIKEMPFVSLRYLVFVEWLFAVGKSESGLEWKDAGRASIKRQ